MTRRLRRCLALIAVLFTCTVVQGQFPDKFTNLKVLPKDVSKQELQLSMRGFGFALGVRLPVGIAITPWYWPFCVHPAAGPKVSHLCLWEGVVLDTPPRWPPMARLVSESVRM